MRRSLGFCFALGGVALAIAPLLGGCGSQSTGVDYGAYGSGNPNGAAGDAGPFATNTAVGQGSTPAVANACRTGQALAQKLPLHIVLMLDRSGSMCEYVPGQDQPRDCNNASSKWQQVRSALAYFFASPVSNGITVSVTQFPSSPNGNEGNCNASLYAAPSATLVALPNNGPLLANIDARQSSNDGNTPTLDALRGGLQIAVNIHNTLTTPARVATVMATDGVPAGCGDNNIGTAAALAQQYAQVIPTYVIGVGNQLQSLDQLALGGGTGQAFIANTYNPQLVGQYVAQALDSIRKSAVGCEYTVPAAPDGKKLDPKKVNVEFTGASGKSGVGYSQDCPSGNGWSYDNPADPKVIKLCANTCAGINQDASAKIDIVFGCETESVK